MATTFSALPIVDLSPLSKGPKLSVEDRNKLAGELHEVFKTVGFAYLVNPPLSFSHDDVFGTAKEFFGMPEEEKMCVAKKTFRPANSNTYRGYFPAQLGDDNLKEGFEVGPTPTPTSARPPLSPFNFTEPNLFPPPDYFPASSRARCEQLHTELQSLGSALLSLLAHALDSPAFDPDMLLQGSASTLRLLHYPSPPASSTQELSCTPHTDSGLLTLLHQDSTGGLEVLNAAGEWIPAPYVPGSLVVNIGDLMAQLSGGTYVATRHRVRVTRGKSRYSVPFFCEPGVDAVVPSPDGVVRYEEFVLGKMKTWVEFQDLPDDNAEKETWKAEAANLVSAAA
ncbi:Clavaminate synthase-like protein [Coniophora puteana RWD-64-598 SS2]|uniref:Clavaminate synthase-like protein n=1 Tax=Coniophora puteana (strain RWD-64-598) TaxID=741705 RepID=A0A5M3M934_CONPW|nr:Clavaminate synthase-like protein [Coniophora puteana RWD-64-598 SS2]EIW75300.1 Clavaminate synthase-like protein [Coniophora puteana RWD-64-598 SS2]